MLKRPTAQLCAAAAFALTGAALAGAAADAAQQPAFRSSQSPAERECLARAMYFESNKSSEDGMLAVGTVVANRLQSGRYGTNACAVVGQRNQFAPGVLSRGFGGEAAARARRVAQAILSGHRHPAVRNAMFFHTAGLRFGYGNMHYLTVAGGNIFYEKRSARTPSAARANALSMARAYATARADQAAAAPVLAVALRTTVPAPSAPSAIPVPTAAPTFNLASTAIRFGTAPLESGSFTIASAYSNASASTPQANSALAAVAALGPKKAPGSSGPRTIAPATPVQASMTPSLSPKSAPKPSPMANFAVAMAWSVFN